MAIKKSISHNWIQHLKNNTSWFSNKPAVWNYVYYKWNNFNEYEEDINDILNRCHSKILENAVERLSVPNIANLEKEMNIRLNKRIDAFRKLFTTKGKAKMDARSQSILTNMLTTFFATKSSFWIQEVLSHLEWDEKTGQPIYTGSNFGLGSGKNSIKRAHLKFTKEHHNYSTLINRVERLKIDVSDYSKDIQDVLKEDFKQLDYKLKELKPQQGKIIKHMINEEGELTDKECQALIDSINNIIDKLNGIDEINDSLGAKFAELMGQLISKERMGRITQPVLDQLFKEFKTGGAGSTNKGVLIDPEFNLESIQWDNEILQIAKDTFVTVDENGNRYSISNIATSATGKLDSTFQIDGKTYGVSIKNYNLYEVIDEMAQQILKSSGAIALQSGSTSLFAYLAGLEKDLNEPHLMKYFLNVLADHEDTNSSLQNARKQAQEILKIHLLSSALTGYGQYKQGRNTELFAIYEKSAAGSNGNRIKLYSALDLIQQSIEKNNQGIIITPSLNGLKFNNEPIGDPNEYPNVQQGFIRTERILAEARQKTYKVSLAKQLLT